MGKKTIVWAYLIVLSLGTILSLYVPKSEVAAKDAIVIPGQAIRLRILANSDLNSDQELKRQVRDRVNAKISVWVKDLTSIKEARKVIHSKLPEIKATAEEVVKEHGSNQTVKVKFGKVQFPTKLYGQFLYPAGDYEAVLITLGEGKGANWWCVLFPPLCFLDFSNGVAVSKGFNEKNSADMPAGPKHGQSSTEQASNSPETQNADSKESVQSGSIPSTIDSHSEHPVSKSVQDESESSQASSTIIESGQGVSKKESSVSSQVVSETEQTVSSQADSKIEQTVSSQGVSNSAVQSASVSSPSEAAQTGTANPEKDQHDSQTTQEDSSKQQKKAPVYVTQDEQPIKVKFFVVELWNKIY